MLGVIVAAVGRGTETYIAHHIASILPRRTTVCSLAPCPNPAWTPSAPVKELYRSRSTALQALRHGLRIAAPKKLQALDLMRLSRWIRRQNVQVVLCEYLDLAVTVLDACRRLSVPVIAHAHGYDIASRPRDKEWAKVYADRLPFIQEIVVVSQAMKEKVLQFGVPVERVHVVPCGTRIDRSSTAHSAKAEYVIVATGRLIGKKGPIFLLESFRQIRQQGLNARLVIAGDGPFREAMEQYLQATNLRRHVELLGEIPNKSIRECLRGADLFLQHSITAANGDEEGLPVSILEAMADGVPVVSTIHAGIPEVVEDGRTGFLVSPKDPTAMARRAVQLLGDADLRSQLAAAAKEVVRERFSLDHELSQLRSLVTKHMVS